MTHTLFDFGALRLVASSKQGNDGQEYPILHVEWRGRIMTTLDAVDARKLVRRIEAWLAGEIP